MQKKIGRNTIVLLGIGHTNAHVLRMWKMQPIANAQLVCVSNFPTATYSGMLPAVLAGQYPASAMEIDLVRLCQSAGARLIVDEVVGLEPQKHHLLFKNRPPLDYELLSIGVGSRPTFRGVEIVSDKALLPVKPMQTILSRLEQKLAAVDKTRPAKLTIVGGGIGSIEIAFCLQRRLADLHNGPQPKITLVTSGQEVGSGLESKSRTTIARLLQERGIQTVTGRRVAEIHSDGVLLTDQNRVDSDAIIWATGAAPPELLARLELPTTDSGFLATQPTLQVNGHDKIFAVGDTGTIESRPTAKAGVFAVRQGPVLWDNLQRSIWKRPLLDYQPQRKFLKLVNVADGTAVAEYGQASYHAKIFGRLKNRIDTRFMAMYQKYDPMPMDAGIDDGDAAEAMRCLGCGGKIGSQLLSGVLEELDVPQHPDVRIGLDQPDDAAVLTTHDNQVTVTTDFFASPLDDPYLTGRIAMLNSASDCFVMGAQPTAALAMIQLPLGHPRGQMQVMRELMAGAVDELRKMDATIVGGHSIEGPRILAGFTVLGKQISDPMTKGMLNDGDRLVLTKPVGSGVLLAALMQCRLPGGNYLKLVETMLQSNQIALRLISEGLVTAITDVTGFGLAGHLAEMLSSSQKSATIRMSDVPLLDGVDAMVAAGIESTLTPDNRVAAAKIDLQIDDVNAPQYTALFDPQTCGGLAMGVSEANLPALMKILSDTGFADAAVIGTVHACKNDHHELVAQP